MSKYSDIVIPPAKLTMGYAEKLIVGVTAANAARLPSAGGSPIQTNHPLFVYGHLSLYPAKVFNMVGLAAQPVPTPARFEELFKNGAPCLDDPNGSIYPSWEAVSTHFFRSMKAVIEMVPSVDESVFLRANPAEGRMRELLPTIGAATNFILGAHAMSHLGQVSAWRRFMGLPSAF